MVSDLLIRNAWILDGTGVDAWMGDVSVRNGLIEAVGPQLTSNASVVVEAHDRFLTPGFIDAHCHDDLVCLRDPSRVDKVTQGVTTVVVGNCSFSLFPCTTESTELLRTHFSGLMGQCSLDDVFEDFAKYREALAWSGLALNVVSLVGHAALRLAVVGAEGRPATQVEIVAMQELLGRQLEQGAAGLSIGLVYPPSAYAERDELVALSRTVRESGKVLAAHIRSYEGSLEEATDEFLEILGASGAKGQLSHLQAAGKPNWGKVAKVLDQLEAARERGIDVEFDMYPYIAGSSYMLQLLPVSELRDGLESLLERVRAGGKERLRRLIEEGHPDPHAPQSKVALIGWENIRISAAGTPELKGFEGLTMTEAATLLGISEFELLLRILEADGGRTSIVMFQLCEEDLRTAFTHTLHMVGSDGMPRPGTKAHPRAFGTFPRVLGKLVRDDKWFSRADAVRRMSSAPAQRFGLRERGTIEVGKVADLVLFKESIEDLATYDEPSLLSAGVVAVWVGGEAVVEEGKPTGKLPGKVLGMSKA